MNEIIDLFDALLEAQADARAYRRFHADNRSLYNDKDYIANLGYIDGLRTSISILCKLNEFLDYKDSDEGRKVFLEELKDMQIGLELNRKSGYYDRPQFNVRTLEEIKIRFKKA